MRPLLYLTYRSLINGLRRALTSPKRLITTAAILLYYAWFILRPLMATRRLAQSGGRLPQRFEFPPLELLDAIVFSGFAGLSLLLALGMFGYRAAFKPADVDVLFPTPVSPRVVLMFRMVRDYLGTLIVPLILVLLLWVPFDLEAVFRNVPHPQSSGYAIRALTLAMLLLTTTWVGIGYATSLYVNRNDRRSELRKKLVAWGLAIPCIVVVAAVVHVALRFQSVADFVHFAQQGWLRIFFFTATPASAIVMGPLDGSMKEMLLGIGVLLGISGLTLLLALRQSDWMYDQAAVRGFGSESLRQLQRKGDIMGVMAEVARQGKLKVRRPGWFQRLRLQGFSALLWKDALIQWRSVRGVVAVFLVIGLVFVAMPYFAGLRGRREGVGYLVLSMQGFVTFMAAMISSQSGFTELLRRVDLQKPLPFGPQRIVLSEVIAKALPTMLITVATTIAGLALFPGSWRQMIAGLIFFPSLAAVICSLVCNIVLLFPEIEDASQRGFRGLVTLLGLAIVASPGALAFAGVGALTASPVIGSIPGAMVNVAVAAGLTAIGGSLYSAFNPSE